MSDILSLVVLVLGTALIYALLGAGLLQASRVRTPQRVTAPTVDLVDVWGRDSFPASDPPANW